MLLLLMFISVASNPLGEDSLSTILDSISTLAAKWFHLGLALRLSHGTLEIIEHNHPKDARRCQTEMITTWLQNSSNPSWQALASALSSLDRVDIATMITIDHPSH